MNATGIYVQAESLGYRLAAQARVRDVNRTLQRNYRLRRPTKFLCLVCGQEFVYNMERSCPNCRGHDIEVVDDDDTRPEESASHR